jgi:two-component system cell cycle response regulator DivK
MSRVLMIDNAALFQLLETSFLKRGVWDIVRAGDGADLIARARAHAPDLILIEADLPGVDGPGCLKTLKTDPQLRGIPVLVVASAESAARCAEAGANATLTRPIDAVSVEEALCALGRIAHREGRRAFSRLPVRVGSPRGALRTRLTDISRTGLFLALPRPLPVQSCVDLALTLPLPEGRRSVRARGVVVRQVLPDRGSHLVPGIGVRFVELDPTTGSILDAYLQRSGPGASNTDTAITPGESRT